jgi:putative transposase
MSRRTPYLAATGEYFHVYNRGVRKTTIFDTQANYAYFLRRAQSFLDNESVRVVCYCLMPNHFHFLLEQVQQGGISKFIQQVCNSYAKALNKQRGQSGHIFESKYKIKLIDSDGYLIWLSRYIHRNPPEAHIARRCGDWHYSSYRHFIGMGKNSIVSPGAVLSRFTSTDEYRQFVECEGESEPPEFANCLFDE